MSEIRDILTSNSKVLSSVAVGGEAAAAATVTSDSAITLQDDEDLRAAMAGLAAEDAARNTPVTNSGELYTREISIGTKSNQSGNYVLDDSSGNRLDDLDHYDSNRIGGNITKGDGNQLHYKGYLGDFDYNPKEWSIGVKRITDEISNLTTEIPVLRYVGKSKIGNDIDIPDGVTCLDYTFEDNSDLETVPYIPDSVESAHAAFMGCTSITRASKDAKEDERVIMDDMVDGATSVSSVVGGGLGVVGGGLAGLKLGVGAGVAAGPVGAFVGGLIGGVGGLAVGALGGGIANGVSNIDNDGKGGTWSMPKNLKDASYMFAGCKDLTEAYESASDSLINARGMYKGAESIGTDEYATKHGSVSVTDFTDSKLSCEAVQESYTGANVDTIKAAIGNYSKHWDDATETMNKPGLSAKEKAEVEELNTTLKEEDIRNGVVENEMSTVTGGIAYSAKVVTENGTRTTLDINDENVKKENSGLSTAAGILDRGLVSFAEFKLLKMVTGNTLLSAGITFGGQLLGILPTSMKPVLGLVADFVGKDNPVGMALHGIMDRLPDTGESTVFAKAKDTPMESDLNVRMKSSMSDSLRMAVQNEDLDISKVMRQNGMQMASEGVFYNINSSSQEFNDMKSVGLITAASLEERVAVLAGSDKQLSDADKAALSDTVMGVMRGLKSYGDGALETIHASVGASSDRGVIGENGLASCLSEVVNPMYQSVKEMNDVYDFMSQEDLDELNRMSIANLPTYESYCSRTLTNPATSELLDNGYTEDDLMYANAGLIDDAVSDKDKKDSVSTSEPKEDSDKAAKLDPEKMDVTDKKNKSSMTREDKIAIVERMTGQPISEVETSDGILREYE